VDFLFSSSICIYKFNPLTYDPFEFYWKTGFDALRKYAIDLTEKARENLLDPVIGRDNEVRRCIRLVQASQSLSPSIC
jgi:ATP-dependent Clp protease ATP-binding subunit ClpA